MIYKDFDLHVPEQVCVVGAPLYMGCEFEIENIVSHNGAETFIIIEQDGSLRNNGYEYITRPLTLEESLLSFTKLHRALQYGPDAFTERTSIHVHVNCCNLTQLEVRNIVLLYALYEEAFFAMVAPARRDNIHCVALTETFLPSVYRANCATLVAKWHKYTALNLKPLSTQGTIEFRHMHGHGDYQLFSEWVTLLSNLFAYGKDWKVTADAFEEQALEGLYLKLFGHTRLATSWKSIRHLMDNQILDVKMSTL